MKTINRDGYSHRLELDDSKYFEESDEFTKIEEGVYAPVGQEDRVLLIHDEDEQVVDLVGAQGAVRDVKFDYRTEFGADLGWNNGVREQYEPEGSFESEETIEALEEFGVQVDGIEQREEEMPLASD